MSLEAPRKKSTSNCGLKLAIGLQYSFQSPKCIIEMRRSFSKRIKFYVFLFRVDVMLIQFMP